MASSIRNRIWGKLVRGSWNSEKCFWPGLWTGHWSPSATSGPMLHCEDIARNVCSVMRLVAQLRNGRLVPCGIGSREGEFNV